MMVHQGIRDVYCIFRTLVLVVIGRWLHSWYLGQVTTTGGDDSWTRGRLGKEDAETVRFQVLVGQDSPRESKNTSDTQEPMGISMRVLARSTTSFSGNQTGICMNLSYSSAHWNRLNI